MSNHKTPLTQVEEEGLRAHSLPIGTPSQLSDAFRNGVAWNQKEIATLKARLEAKEKLIAAMLDEVDMESV